MKSSGRDLGEFRFEELRIGRHGGSQWSSNLSFVPQRSHSPRLSRRMIERLRQEGFLVAHGNGAQVFYFASPACSQDSESQTCLIVLPGWESLNV